MKVSGFSFKEEEEGGGWGEKKQRKKREIKKAKWRKMMAFSK